MSQVVSRILLLTIVLAGCAESHGRATPEPDGGLFASLDAAASLDAGAAPDAGPECPSDPASVDGDPCAPEGLWCGECTDSCASCRLLACIDGRWMRPTAGPAGEPCTSFECGPELRCAAERQYCQHVLSDTDVPDDFACEPLPADCSGCECFPDGGCTESAGAVTVTSGGG